MKLTSAALAVCILVMPFAAPPANACTSIVTGSGSQTLLGLNYDFALHHGALFINAAGKRKTSLADHGERALTWTARFSSAVLSQFGRELPIAGINEAGLTIQGLWNEDSGFAPVDPTHTAALNELQWIQYQLDQHRSLDEVEASLANVPIRRVVADLHYVVCEASGDCALIEYESRALRVYRASHYAPRVITNSVLSSSRQFAKTQTASRFAALPNERQSLHAYARAAWLAQRAPDEDASTLHWMLEQTRQNYRFSDLFAVFTGRAPSVTAWSAVISPSGRWIEWRSRGNGAIRRLELTTLFRRCPAPDLALDIDTPDPGTVAQSSAHVESENRRIITAAYKPIARQFPAEAQEELVRYPASFECSP